MAKIRHSLRAVTFDFWGTLVVDTPSPEIRKTFKQMKVEYFVEQLAACGITLSPPQVMAAYFHARERFDALWAQEIAFDAALGVSEMEQVLRIQIPPDARERIIRYFEEKVNDTTLPLFPGTRETLQQLATRYKLGLISDTAWTPGRVLREQMRRSGIFAYFDTMVFSGEFGFCKPNARLFSTALAALGVAPGECLHVGDLQFTDIKGAKAIGCYAAWIRRPDFLDNARCDYGPDLIIDRVADLQEILLA